MTRIAQLEPTRVTVGVDTHRDVHVAVALDQLGRRLGEIELATTRAGYQRLLAWAERFGAVEAFGIEGTGCYGAGLARYLGARKVLVIEVMRPNRQTRRRKGKSDPTDAEAAARAVLSAEAAGSAKAGDDLVEMIRVLRVARQTAIKARTQAISPRLLEAFGVGADTAGALLVAAGDNPERLRSEAAFSMLCGSSPINASSGKTNRHRLNRGGNRQANAALHRIVLVRMRYHQPTRTYVDRRTSEGTSKREIMRCLKRYVAREVYTTLTQPDDKKLARAA